MAIQTSLNIPQWAGMNQEVLVSLPKPWPTIQTYFANLFSEIQGRFLVMTFNRCLSYILQILINYFETFQHKLTNSIFLLDA